MIFVYITCKNKKEAQKIGQALVKERLAGCVNFWPIDSVYWWNGKIIKDKEVVLIIKTLKSKFQEIETRIKKMHSYKIPCIVSLPINKISQKYFNWLKKEIE